MNGKSLPHIIRPLIEVLGTDRVLIEYHRGICTYSDQRITVRVNYGMIHIIGDCLKAVSMTKDVLVISGKIFQLILNREGESH